MLRAKRFGFLSLFTVLALAVSATACMKNPYDAATWTAKLDGKDWEDAVTKLDQLGDAKAIPALVKAWERQGKPSKILQVIINLARPLNKEEYLKVYYQENKTRDASWEAAFPALKMAIEDMDESKPALVDQAIKAADALGDSGYGDGLGVLTSALKKSYNKNGLRAQIAFINAVGKYKQASSISALSEVLAKEGLDLFARGAAVNAIGTIGGAESMPVLIETMYQYPALFEFCRRALAAIGPDLVAAEGQKILRGQNTTVNTLFTAKKLDQYCVQGQCEEVSMKDYYAAIILGDTYSTAVVPDLLAALAKPAKPAYYFQDQPGPVQHAGVIDALRKIGAAESAAALKGVWTGAGDVKIRVMALSAYAFTARDASALPELAAIFKDDSADQNLRLAAAETYGRLAKSTADIAPLIEVSKRYQAESAKRLAEANGTPKTAFEAAKAEMEAKKKDWDAVKGTPAETAPKEAYAKAKGVFEKAQYAYKPLLGAAKDYTAFQRTFENHVARIEIAIRCKDAACLAASLKAKPEDIAANLAAYIPNIKETWTKDEKKDLVAAQIDRAMIELAKMGKSASGETVALLDGAKTDDSLVRQAILLALPKVAAKPCPECVTKLEAAAKSTEGKSTAASINVETVVLKNHFAAQK